MPTQRACREVGPVCLGIAGRLVALWLLLVAAACAPVQRVDLSGGNNAPAPVEPRVLVVTLQGKLGTQELARCHRAVREAEAVGCSYVVFRLETAGSQGENPSDLQSLYDRVQGSDVKSVAVLRGHCTQGAAGLALVCHSVYCLPDASWGEVNKPDQEVEVLLADDPEGEMARLLDAEREMMVQRLQRRGTPLRPDAQRMAIAMVDPRVQLIAATVREGGLERLRVLDANELQALQGAGAKVFGEHPLPHPLVLTAREAEDHGLSNGTLQGYSQLADVLLIDAGLFGELTTNWAEQMVGWLELLQPFLLVAGFLLLLVEIKTPGVGVPGLLGVLFLGLALFHSYLVGLAEVTEILVFFLGLGAIAVEIFLLPGTVIFGITGFLCLILALVLSRQSFVIPGNAVEQGILLQNLANLTLLFLLVMVLGALLWRVLPRVPLFNRVFLPPPLPRGAADGGSAPSGLGLDNSALTALVGKVGTAATTLRPAGEMELGGDRIDVVTEGEFVEAGERLRVVHVQGTRVVVARAAADPRSGERGSVGIVVLLCIVGLALIVGEVIFVSFGVLGAAAAVSLLGAIFVAFQESMAFGIGMSIFEAIAAPVVLLFAFRLLPYTPFGKALILSGPATQGSAAAADDGLQALLHQQGVTLSACRPAGFARIDGRKVDVVTRGEMLPADCQVVVVDVGGNRVVVQALAGTPPST